jgi:PAS domain S-box-containing protein
MIYGPSEAILSELAIHGTATERPAQVEPTLSQACRLAAAAAHAREPLLTVDATGISGWHWDTAGDIISWTACTGALRLSCSDRQSLLDRVAPEDQPAFKAVVEDALRLPGPRQLKLRMLDRLGHLRWCLWQGQAIPAAGGNSTPSQLFGTLIDIDEGRTIRERADELASQKRALLENLPDVAWMKDVDGRFIAVNRQFCERFGLDPDHAEGKTDRDIYPSEKADAIRRDDERVLSSGQPVRYESCHIVNGQENWVEVLKRPIFDAEGRVIGTVGASRDISARKAAERELGGTAEALRRATERLQLALEGSQLALWDTDLASGAIYLSEGWASLASLPAGETHTSMQELITMVHPDDQATLLTAARETVKGVRSEYLVEHRIRTPDGQWKWILSRGKVTQRDAAGRALRMSGTNMDITGRKAMETALESARDAADAANRAKSAFLATMSHEIRTPMNGVLGMMELLEMTPLTSEQQETARMAHDSAAALLRLIDDILDFSKIEAGQLEIRRESVSIAKVANQSVAIYKDLAARKQLPLEFHIDSALSDFYVSDALRLSQIINNLLSNAIKFTDTGRVRLDIGVVEHRNRADLVSIRVSDSGIGVPKSQQAHLFRPFAQADSSTARKYGGTGLGLSICERLARMMGGSIHMDSVQGKGTVMTVLLELPVSQVADHGMSPETSRSPAALTSHGGRVLIAEDHPINLDLLMRQLRMLGYEADSASDGAQALLKWRTGDYQLILTDCHMPNMDGYEMARAVRSEEASRGSRPIPIVACTASALAGESDLCFAAGMNDYLPKPVTIAELRRTLERWMPLEPTGAGSDSGTTGLEKGRVGEMSNDVNPALQPIDLAALEQFTGGDKDIERDIFRQFLDATRADAQALRQTIGGSNPQASAKAAHRVKGSSRMMGANPLADVAEQMEKAGKAGDAATILALLPAFEQEHARLLAWLEAAIAA